MLLQLPNSCEFAVALFGLLRAGAIPVMCLTGHRAAELGHFAAVSQAKALLIADYRSRIRLPADGAGTGRRITPGSVTSSSTATPDRSCRGRNCARDTTGVTAPGTPDPGSPAVLLVSGGTTGLPKLIPRTHDDYVYNATASAEVCTLTCRRRLSGGVAGRA